MKRKVGRYVPKRKYTAEEMESARVADLLADARFAERQAKEGPFYPEKGITAESLKAYAAKCYKEAGVKKNPTKRKRATPSRVARKTRTPAQKAATARMLRANKARRVVKRSGQKWADGKRTPAQRSARKRVNTVAGYYPNATMTVAERRASQARARRRAAKTSKLTNQAGKYKVYAWTDNEFRSHIATFADKVKAFEYARGYNAKYKCRVTVET